MIEDQNRIYTQSIRCAAFITYKTGVFPKIQILDKGNTFVFLKNFEVMDALNTYKKSQYNKDVLMGDLNAYDEICKQLKRMCKELNKKDL